MKKIYKYWMKFRVFCGFHFFLYILMFTTGKLAIAVAWEGEEDGKALKFYL